MTGTGPLAADLLAQTTGNHDLVREIETRITYNNELVEVGRFKVGLTGVSLDSDVTLDEIAAFAKLASLLKSAYQWIIADIVAFSENELRKTAEDMVKLLKEVGLEYESETLRRWGTAAKNIPREIRVPRLSFAHHQVVGIESLTDSEKKEYLQRAVENKWSVDELAAAVTGKRAKSREPALVRRVNGLSSWKRSWDSMDQNARVDVVNQLRDMLEQMEADLD